MNTFEKTYSVNETAKILGLCLDSVRRHLRSGKMPGVRVGRQWRIAESQLAAYMGAESLTSSSPATTTTAHVIHAQPNPETSEILASLLHTRLFRSQILDIVKQAALNDDLHPKKMDYLLHDLEIILNR